MAEASIVIKEDEFICMVCLDLLTDPVSLACGHSFCMPCITCSWDQSLGISTCPQCRESFASRPVLRRNNILAGVVEKLKESRLQVPGQCYAKSEEVECDLCTGIKSKAVKSCLVCLASFCEDHFQPHKESSALMKHTVIEASAKLHEKICSLHGRPLDVFCRTDQKIICYLCTLEEHAGHNLVSGEAEKAEKEKQVMEAQNKYTQRILEQEEDQRKLVKNLDIIQHSAQIAVDDVEKLFKELIQCVEEKCWEVTKQIRDKENNERDCTKEQLKEVNQVIDKLKSKNEELLQLLQTEDIVLFLQILQSFGDLSLPEASPRVNINKPHPYVNIKSFIHKLKNYIKSTELYPNSASETNSQQISCLSSQTACRPTQSSLFSSNAGLTTKSKPVFSTPFPKSSFVCGFSLPPVTKSDSIFGISTTPVTKSDFVFGKFTTPVTKSNSVFGISTTPVTKSDSVFGISTTPVTKSDSVFGKSTTPVTKSDSVFGISTTPVTKSDSVFGISTTPVTKSDSVFGISTTPVTKSDSVFGISTTPVTKSDSVFGISTTPVTKSDSVFGISTTPVSKSNSVFGISTTPVTKSNSVFGISTTPVTKSNSVFGISTTPVTKSDSVFGKSTTPVTKSNSVFGISTTSVTKSNSVFGISTPPITKSNSVFGISTTPVTKSDSVFGKSTTPVTKSDSVFGISTTPVTKSDSVFGKSTTPVTKSNSVFGISTTPVTKSDSVFGISTTPVTKSDSVFGISTTPVTKSKSVFGISTTPVTKSDSEFGISTTPVTKSDSEFGISTTPVTKSDSVWLSGTPATEPKSASGFCTPVTQS